MPSMTMAANKVPGLLSAGNINLAKRPVVKNPDGTISTVRSMSFNEDGREILVPTVSPEGGILSDDDAINLYHQTGQHLGMFDNPQDADTYAQSLHNQQDQMYSPQSTPTKGARVSPGSNATASNGDTITLEIEGKDVEIDSGFLNLSPEDQQKTVQDIASQMGIRSQGGPQDDPQTLQGDDAKNLAAELSDMTVHSARREFESRPSWQKPIIAAVDIIDAGANGLTMGFGNKASAALRSQFTGRPYDEELQTMRVRSDAARDRSGNAGTAAELGGAIYGPALLAGKGLTLAGRFGTGAMAGAKGAVARTGLLAAEGGAYGGLSAAGNDTDIGQGIGLGVIGGAAVPIVSRVGGALIKPVADAVRGYVNPAGYAAQKVAERVSASLTPAQAAAKLAQNPGSNLADVAGESAQGLLRSAANIPGTARNVINSRLTMRQFGQGDRLKSAIAQTFADPDGYLAAKDSIAEAAKQIAAPLYRKAYANPVHFSETLEGILSTPAGKQALQHAEQLAANEQVPFQQLFVNVGDSGSASVRRVPDTRGWDYIKRAMDDMIDGQTDSITKKVTNEGRILTGLKSKMLGEIDRLNPDYKAARQAFGGQAQLDDALEAGRDVFKASPEAFKRTVSVMTDAQKASARIGAAETLRAQIDAAGATQNAVLRVFSKPQQIRNLQTLFETPRKFAEFRKAIFAEARKRGTYERVKNNSSTVAQAADMAEAGGLRDTAEFAKNVASGRPVTATLQWLGSRLKMLGGFTPEVADNIGRQLLASSPQAQKQIIAQITAINRLQASNEVKRQAIEAFITRSLATGGGAALARAQ
ncbi:hypothetical protein E0H93_17630 [Rhizobium leguminosarum bv. viciae]|uniref:hypothetical protein n=1 Tax=Rhizobium leguminosarum TaxID=384 RepID=UPI00103C8FF8|nr:hypothetical protein [Rhizobium leguminosarum]TCB05141.1 hypothetical protein E0H93_17630 [Rhizobium leguminosarum bv. viciae]